MRFKMLIAYDGSHLSGWQVQPNAPSVQGEIEKALALLLRHPVSIVGSGRTDAGVHAMGQTAHFDADEMPKLHALNSLLTKDIRIIKIEEAKDSFHAQYSATGKIYHYHLWLDPVADPFSYKYSYKVPFPISTDLLAEAATLFVGTHDFKSFSNLGSSVKTTVRQLRRLDIVQERGGLRLEFEGGGFLYKMVRNIVGTLLEVASHQRKVADIAELFAAKDRRAVGVCAPAHGLFLMQVKYETSRCDESAPADGASQSHFVTTQK